MYATCSKCSAATWVQPVTVAHVSRVTCDGCGHVHQLGELTRLGTRAKDYRRRAVEFGENHRLDLARAYSVLLGMMTLEQAQADRATERLIELHGLTKDMARRVATGEIRLHEARRMARRTGRKLPRRRLYPSTSGLQLAVVTGVAGVLALGLFVYSRETWRLEIRRAAQAGQVATPAEPEPEPVAQAARPEAGAPTAAPPPRPRMEILTDDDGRLVRVSAADPRDVLVAFCAHSPAGSRQPLELASTVTNRTDRWLGVFRDTTDLGKLYALSIHKDRRTRRWAAGDGRRPLQGFPIEHERMGDRRIAIAGR